ncbi:hypothetical protein T265_13469 [Opisthorchis viverrini]|uniref:Uncharacterized protein n=1 Tax=Opisthorchis viverrini TaxID=6198 RepID=A0A075AGS1_OPIVI|nr:hypothetical protein T265_13469 [Opisthorchis viverrini]KER29004.1 hypothetical protein T265_13469 [Opisthorchis viverrini]
MLNLLCRIATFCIKEFAAISLQATVGRTSSSLLTWITWMVSTRYAGGPNPSGSGLSAELVKHLETSMYLSTDVLLAHMSTVPPPTKQRETECSSAALWLRSATIQPTVRLRVYAGILLNLPKNPHFYSRWVGEEFNIYSEFFTTCAQINTEIPINDESNADTVGDSLTALATEFYTSLLKQVCASICALPAGCYHYLEQALLRGLLVNHPWTNLFVADVWCFLARYGPGELCWHYVNLFASAIQQMAVRSSSDAGTLSERVAMRLDRLGRVLARFLVFLTPKQQSQFFERYPLREAALPNLLDPATEHQAPLIWRFVPLTLSRLQKPAQTMLEEQLDQRLIGLVRTVERHSLKKDWDIELTVETMKTIASAFACVSPDSASPVCRPLLANLKQVLSQVSCEHPMDVEDEGVLRCIRQVDDALNQLECKWKSDCSHSSVNMDAVRKLNHRFHTFLRNLDVTSQL